MEASFWDGKRAPGVVDQIDPDKFKNLGEVIEHAVHQYGDRPAYTSMGRTVTFNDVERLSTEFAAYIQNHIYAFCASNGVISTGQPQCSHCQPSRYGLSEASPVVPLNPAGSYSKPGTVGLPCRVQP